MKSRFTLAQVLDVSAFKIVAKLKSSAQLVKPWGAVTHIYNPLDYAEAPLKLYFTRNAKAPIETLFLGMNPGPFGMAQTGIPFGDVASVRNYLDISAPIRRPPNQHPSRPILGFECVRQEISGRRFWTWIEKTYGSPEVFATKAFVWNFCPLAFMDKGGKNLTPDKLKSPQLDKHLEDCRFALAELCKTLKIKKIIGVGHFAHRQAQMAVPKLPSFYLQHPSPINPHSAKNWGQMALRLLTSLH
jgi:single-strand selective monofunctional uracil DNA glycosylase